MSEYAPVILFVYKRADLAKRAIDALQKNYLAEKSELFIFSDAAKSNKDQEKVNEVRKYIESVKYGFSNVYTILRQTNYGCAKSVISGVTEIINKYGKVIVVEDDLVTTPNFLDYMNEALNFYQDKNVFSICGHSLPIDFPTSYDYDVYFSSRAGSWGWASWIDKWQNIDWQVLDYEQFKKDKKARKRFNLGGDDMAIMLDKQMSGKIDSWAIRWCYAQSKLGLLTVYPTLSKVKNLGFGSEATHSKHRIGSNISLDYGNKRNFRFSDKIELNESLIKQFRYYFSFIGKVRNRINNLFIR